MKYQAEGNYLVVEALDDDLIHFEYGSGLGPGTDKPIMTTDMVCNKDDQVPSAVCKTDFRGPTEFSDKGSGVIETKEIRLEINTSNLFVTIIDKTKNNLQLTTIRPLNLHQGFKGLIATRSEELDIYGLGQQFVEPGRPHIENLCNCKETAPDRIGDFKSNLENTHFLSPCARRSPVLVNSILSRYQVKVMLGTLLIGIEPYLVEKGRYGQA